MNPDDPRAQRSRARLRETVLRLAADEDPASITMAAVAKHAGVHRATIYQHFPDVDTLLAEAMADAVAHVARAAALCPLEAPATTVPPPLTELFQRFDDAAPLYRRMLGPQGSAQFAAHLRERLTAELAEAFRGGRRPPGFDDVPLPLHAAYLSGALIGVLATWVTDPAPVAATEATEAAAAFWRLFRG
ncbi:TetR/AcrR family transcriptional regulator [Labedaea rhizosphaerae]|uniref:TetR family transcriptional regulator n=1 Tax=Labedaea rhizosphaerae TaxID=598644 RepID=A0A4R6SMA0_LABRH|nr:TetR/AcrR family transcriptional regulator [Labedaea rhizosphaerae]TDQ05034.1 TetR family transcriptional regulator [Labedaea rhizosphaerae]